MKSHYNLWNYYTKYSFLLEAKITVSFFPWYWSVMTHGEVTMHEALQDPGMNWGDTCSYSPSRCLSALLASCMCCLSGISDPSGFAGCSPMYPSLDRKPAVFGTVLQSVVAFSHTGGKIPYHRRTTDGRQSRKFNRNTNWKKSQSISIYFS